jgi:EAL domain-containing protein (putative c-di-GMP-specific phosphodiesterase class I)
MGSGKDQSHPHFAGRTALADYVRAQEQNFSHGGTIFIIDFARHSELAVAMNVDDMTTLIAEILAQLEGMARDHGQVFRVDSSLFGILWNTALNKGQCVLACTRILRELRNLPFCRHAALEIGPRIGVAEYELDQGSTRDSVNAAYLALDHTHEVYPQYAIFEPSMREIQHRNWQLRRELTRAVERQEFVLYYQPRVDLQSGRCLGVEALMRWNSPRLGKVSPTEFVPVMENSGLIAEVTDWVFRRGAHELAAWLKEDKEREFAFNVSARVLMDPEFGESVKQSIGLWTMNPKQVVLEITETTIWGDRETSIPVLEELRNLGVKVAIDDFGTGYSTLEYLRDLAVDQIKIDKSFVMRMLDSKRDRFIVELVIGIAREFDLEVVAEGAESLEILKVLKQIGCATAQGYGIAKPLAHQDLIDWSENLRNNPLKF